MTRSSMMTFAVNVTKAGEGAPGSVWDQLSPLTKLCIIACVANRAQFEKDAVTAVRIPSFIFSAYKSIVNIKHRTVLSVYSV